MGIWDEFMYRALLAAQESPDPSTQNGAVLLTEGGPISDCNRFPEGVEYTTERWERPLKYGVIEHAERNVIYAAAYHGWSSEASTMICPWAACADCARAIIQSGICHLVRLPAQGDLTNPRWADSIGLADTMMAEAGVMVTEIKGHFGVTLRRDGQLVEF